MARKRLHVLLRIYVSQLVGFILGAATAMWILFPATGELDDAFRPYMAVMFGIVGLFLSTIYVAWLCCREL